MFGIGPTELLIVLGIMLLLFGTRLPSIARSMGKSITEFKRGMHEDDGSTDRLEQK
ncbi:MAG: twin-arginine translocase TatA/TatE family subunit [Pirellulales bacterium]